MSRKSIVKRVLVVLLIVVLGGIAWAGIQVVKALHEGGKNTPAGETTIPGLVTGFSEIVSDPYSGFPNQNRIVICGMGIDDSWTNSDEVYTSESRTDTLFLLTLDLHNRKATMLSIPRDTYTHIAGTDYSTKINAAFTQGGPQRTLATVAELTGVKPDYYMVLNIDATKRLVDALGGVDVDVPHEMHYHDKWGHLSIDLMPGQQHLNGDQAVGFVRYRHPDAGMPTTPEDGDVRRMARQHILLRAMVARAKNFANVAQVGTLINIGMNNIRTDMTRVQLLDLAAIYHGVQPEDIQTASLPGEDFHGPYGEWDYRLYPAPMKAYIDWLVRGDATAPRRLTPVVVENSTTVKGLAAHAADALTKMGYSVTVSLVRIHPAVTAASTATATTDITDTGVPDADIVNDIKSILAIPNAQTLRKPNKPNHLGWTAPSSVVVVLGQDYAQSVQASGGMSAVASGVATASIAQPSTPTVQ